MALIAPSRRRLLQFAAAAAVAPGLAGLKARPVIGRVLAVSDLHSAYERTPHLLAAFEHEIRSHPVPHVIAINGDIFEQGNVVAQRSDAAVDWAFLAALPALAPTVVNLGNHDNDLTPDLADVVARMKGLGLHVVSMITDTRTGAGYASPTATLPFGDHRLRVVGMATNSMNTYPKASRDLLSIPAAADWARANLSDSLSGADKVMVMSHAGVVADRDILPLLPEGALMVGGHDHLLFQHRQGASAYVHTGSFTSAYTVAAFAADGSVTAASHPVSTDGPASPALAALTTKTLADQLTPDERTVLWTGRRAMSLGDTGRVIATGMARAAGAHAGFIGPHHPGQRRPGRSGQPLRVRFHCPLRRRADDDRGDARPVASVHEPIEPGPPGGPDRAHRRLSLRLKRAAPSWSDPHRHDRLVRDQPAEVFRDGGSGFRTGAPALR